MQKRASESFKNRLVVDCRTRIWSAKPSGRTAHIAQKKTWVPCVCENVVKCKNHSPHLLRSHLQAPLDDTRMRSHRITSHLTQSAGGPIPTPPPPPPHTLTLELHNATCVPHTRTHATTPTSRVVKRIPYTMCVGDCVCAAPLSTHVVRQTQRTSGTRTHTHARYCTSP